MFGTKIFVLNKNQNKNTFSPRAEERICMNYSEVSKSHRIWMPHQRRIVIEMLKVMNEDCDFFMKKKKVA